MDSSLGRPIRVLELRSALGPGGGPEKTILRGTAQADPRRFSVQVCYLRDQRDPAFSFDRRAQGKIDYVEILERHSYDPRIWTALRETVRRGAFDIVHSHDYKTNFLNLWLGRFESVIPLATAHGWVGSGWRERALYYPIDRRVLAKFPTVIAVSGSIRDQLVAAGAESARVRVIRNGIDPGEFRRDPSREAAARGALGLASDALVLGALGRIAPEKRIDVLLDAFAIVRADEPRARLLIGGSGAETARLEKRAAALGLGDSARFLGHIDDPIGFHHALDLYVQASDREGTPNALLEAMALETPIVATSVDGTPDLAVDGEHAILCPRGDPPALAAAIGKALAEPSARRTRAGAARRRVEGELSFGARMAAVEAIYEELVGARERRERA